MSKELGVIKNGESVFPFFGKEITRIVGLDPLGQQNASEKLYAHLLPGITNLTNRIRYYGFYCWLLAEYDRVKEEKYNQHDQRRFIRRAELTIAVVLNHQIEGNVLQIPGSIKAEELLKILEEQPYLDISEYTDDNTKDGSYWKYASGAFGQYYASSISQMGLIKAMEKDSHLVYMVTEEQDYLSGLKLADSFTKNISTDARNLFHEVLKTGKLHAEYIPTIFKSFNLTEIPKYTDEWHNYHKLITGPDLPTEATEAEYHRSTTINIILSSAEKGTTSSDFLNTLFREELANDNDKFTTRFGWFQYRLNEFWQYSCGTFFWGILEFLKADKDGIYPKDELIEEFTERIIKKSEATAPLPFKDTTYEIDIDQLQQNINQIKSSVKSKDPITAAGIAIDNLQMLFHLSDDRINHYSQLIREKNLDQNGSFLSTYKMLIDKELLHQPIKPFLLKFLNQYILSRHKLVALNKMGNGSLSTLKFDIEDDLIIFENNFEPALTNPRLNTLLSILSDLQILNQEENGYFVVAEQTNL